MTSGSATRRAAELRETETVAERDAARRRRVPSLVAWSAVAVVLVAIVAAGLLSARPRESGEVRVAPDFTLSDSLGGSVTLSSLRGYPVLLYFNEGAGCDACIAQMGAVEDEAGFAEDGVRVLPIVMNTAQQINADRERLGVQAPFLLDDGTVSAAYGTLGTGMHAGLPGHGFVLVDAAGTQVWQGDYPSMWIDPAELLGIVRGRL